MLFYKEAGYWARNTKNKNVRQLDSHRKIEMENI